MRTLKKTLCLVLVLAMMVGLCAMGASAAKIDDYKDKDAIEHKEAVAVLSALGVLEGDENGFRPNDTLNRAEAAAFMTRLLAATGAGASNFTDMVGHWAQPYVAYCEANGIINGLGDGTFGPASPLTVVQFAKMCICALGFNAKVEGLVGNQWEINTIKLINKLDLAAGLTNLDYNAAITRDAAAQMAFNTLKQTMVEYEGGINVEVKTGDGTDVSVNSDPLWDYVDNNSYSYWSTNATNPKGENYDGTMEFCENYFPNLKMRRGYDKYKMSTATWWMGSSRKDTAWTPAKTIATEITANILATYDTNMLVSDKQLFADSKKALGNTLDLTVIENGYEIENDVVTVNKSAGATFQLLKYSGATVYLVDTNVEGDPDYGIADTLIVKYPVIAKVAKVNAASNKAARSIDLDVYTKAGASIKLTKYETEKYNRGDVVLFYPDGIAISQLDALTTIGNPIETKVPDSANGTLTRVTIATDPVTQAKNASALTINGVSYPAGSALLAKLGPATNAAVPCAESLYNLGTGLTAYMNNGFVLGVVADAVTYGHYVFAYATSKVPGIFSTTFNTGIVKQDATTEIITASNVVASNHGNGQYDYDTVHDTWATVAEIGTTKTITLAENETVEFYTKALKPGTAQIGGTAKSGTEVGGNPVIADAKTTFVIQKNGTFKSYVGIAAVPGYTKDEFMTGYALVPGGDPTKAHAVAVFINVDDSSAIAGETSKIFMTTGVADYRDFVDGKAVYYYTAIVDGAKKDDIKSNAESLNASGLVTPTYTAGSLTGAMRVEDVDFDGKTNNNTNTVLVNARDTYKAGTDAEVAISVANNVMTVKFDEQGGATKEYVLDPNAKVIAYNAALKDIDTSIATIDDLNGMAGNLTLIAASGTDYTVKTIYYVFR
jgi:hypothetical protein